MALRRPGPPDPLGPQPVHQPVDQRRQAVLHRGGEVGVDAALAAGDRLDRIGRDRHALDAEAMHQAAQVLLGENDFSAFRAAECQSTTPMRNMMAIKVWRSRQFVVIDLQANAFVHHMVRNIAGSLLEIGAGRRPVTWIAELLAGRDRNLAGMTAAAQGLYFVGPAYPAEFGLPPPPEPWFPA